MPANNPRTAGLAAGEKLLRRCEECARFAVDECFLDFLPDADGWTAKPLLESGNLVILKAFTKLYGMAGVRLGYCLCGDETILEKMQTAGQPWAVSSLAQAAGVAALKETAYVDEVRALIARQRPVLTAGLRALGLRVIDGKANYLLFRAPADLNERLRPLGTQGAAARIIRPRAGVVPHGGAHGSRERPAAGRS
ncbi:MAG: aminotransferase class I/II-fold pyridoxal phosphate-dependent enzyme [Faecalibacterium prausnitzii]